MISAMWFSIYWLKLKRARESFACVWESVCWLRSRVAILLFQFYQVHDTHLHVLGNALNYDSKLTAICRYTPSRKWPLFFKRRYVHQSRLEMANDTQDGWWSHDSQYRGKLNENHMATQVYIINSMKWPHLVCKISTICGGVNERRARRIAFS